MDLNLLAFLVGVSSAVAVAAFAAIVGLDRDRAFYATLMIVIALLYDLFAVLGGSTRALLLESTVAASFVAVAVLGFKRDLWWVAAALAAHGIFDFFHGGLIANPGVPAWWPAFCGSYDVVAAGCLAARLKTGRLQAKPA